MFMHTVAELQLSYMFSKQLSSLEDFNHLPFVIYVKRYVNFISYKNVHNILYAVNQSDQNNSSTCDLYLSR